MGPIHGNRLFSLNYFPSKGFREVTKEKYCKLLKVLNQMFRFYKTNFMQTNFYQTGKRSKINK